MLHDRYEIQHSLGKKAGRHTLLARDTQTEELVVVKLLTFNHDLEWDDLKLFEREAETLKTLNYSEIPRYLDYFEFETENSKGFALVQSYIEAKSLEQHLKAGRSFSEAEVKQLARSLLEILNYLHSQHPPVIHRDLKPSNILLSDRTGNSVGQVYLVDFGSVQTLVAQEGSTITVVGTYGYMPPEQYGGRATPASDLYSLGATLIYLTTGKHPADLPQENLRIRFQSFATINEAFSDWLEWLTEPALDQRLASAQAAIQALEEGKSRSAIVPLSSQAIVSPMTRERVLWNAIWRSAALGAIVGAGSVGGSVLFHSMAYSVYSSKLALLVNILLYSILGGAMGLGLGFFHGLVVGALTNAFRKLSKRGLLYRMTIAIAPTAFTLVLMLAVVRMISPSWGEVSFVIVALELAMGLAGQLFAHWYLRESRKIAQKK
jgi:eukaryotic-like serine/threonine-protein kinase